MIYPILLSQLSINIWCYSINPIYRIRSFVVHFQQQIHTINSAVLNVRFLFNVSTSVSKGFEIKVPHILKLSIFNTYGTIISELDIKVYVIYNSCVHKKYPLLLHIAIPDHIQMFKWILLTTNIQGIRVRDY